MADIYIGNGKQNQKLEWIVNANICVTSMIPGIKKTDFTPEIQEFVFVSEKNGKVYLPLEFVRNKTVDNYGNSHSVKVNTYKKDAVKTDTPKDDESPF